MDGTSPKLIVTTKLAKPIGLTIDHANRHLYWSDMELNVIERVDFKGDDKSRRVISLGLKVGTCFAVVFFFVLIPGRFLPYFQWRIVYVLPKWDRQIPYRRSRLTPNLKEPGPIPKILKKQNWF
ncbi:hypothetical protein DPMN_184512 [Dreissena polymorpha]|uniref:Uncharacterized protein n=1 Tax=Dreissena polymorpha TaxID=45954 RepID=A0A9D4I4P2_DREPO|nr:hypothetical protein DPMN_184512 [Dreissena polymorpha]